VVKQPEASSFEFGVFINLYFDATVGTVDGE
jgi:hypothetical protein